MTKEPVNKYFGTPLSEWVDMVPNELDMDAVGLWQVIEAGRDGFELHGRALEDFVRRCVISLLSRGAVPVMPSAAPGTFWERQFYDGDIEDIASQIVEGWRQTGVDPDQDGLWFTLLG